MAVRPADLKNKAWVKEGWELIESLDQLTPGTEFYQWFGDDWNHGVVIGLQKFQELRDTTADYGSNKVYAEWDKYGVSYNYFNKNYPVQIPMLVAEYDPAQAGDKEDDI